MKYILIGLGILLILSWVINRVLDFMIMKKLNDFSMLLKDITEENKGKES